jgi:ribosomal protein L1
MAKLTKKQKEVAAKFDVAKSYNISEASSIVKETTSAKFDAGVDLAIRLGVDPRKANQMVRGVVTLPHGTGKDVTLFFVLLIKQKKRKLLVLIMLVWMTTLRKSKKVGLTLTLLLLCLVAWVN